MNMGSNERLGNSSNNNWIYDGDDDYGYNYILRISTEWRTQSSPTQGQISHNEIGGNFYGDELTMST